MDWLLEKFPILVVAFVVLARVISALVKSRTAQDQHARQHDETEEQRRVREVQERIRRAIASRRGGQPAGDTAPPVLRPMPTVVEDSDPFRGEDRSPVVVAPDPAVVARVARNAELERQAQLAEKMRVLAEAKDLARYRAEQAATEAKSANPAAAVRRQRFDEIIRDRENLRRAILVREILGPPVGLR